MHQAPTVISATCQEFNGTRYYLCGPYYRRCWRDFSRLLHRDVYQAFHGPIPRGHHVHHKDHDRANNHPENLVLLTAGDHMRRHHEERSPEERKRLAKNILHAQASAAAWHGSAAGVEWHRQNYDRVGHLLHERNMEHRCAQCGAPVWNNRTRTDRYYFCGRNCKSEHRRRSGVDDETRTCQRCGAPFTINRYASKRYCTRSCAAHARQEARRGRSASG